MDSSSLNALHDTLLEILIEIDRVCKENDIKYFLDSGTALGAIRHNGFIPWDDDIDIGMLRSDYEQFLKIAPSSLKAAYFLQTRETDKEYNKLHAKIRKNDTVLLEAENENIQMHHGIFIDIFPFDRIPKRFSRFFIWLNQVYQRMYVYNFVKNSDQRTKLKIFISGIFVGKKPQRTFDKLCKMFNKTSASGLISYNYSFNEHYVFDKKNFDDIVEKNFEGSFFMLMNGYDEYLRIMYGSYMELPPIEKRVNHNVKELKL